MVIAVDKGFDVMIWSACHEAKLLVFLLNKLIVISCERKDFKSSKKRLLLVKVENENKEANRWFSRYVIADMLVDENKRFLISSFCSSTSNCTLQHCYLCPKRLVANHL